jgi:hypothetical protein
MYIHSKLGLASSVEEPESRAWHATLKPDQLGRPLGDAMQDSVNVSLSRPMIGGGAGCDKDQDGSGVAEVVCVGGELGI